MKLHSIFITGANRGLGLEFVKQLVKWSPPPEHIFAAYRSGDEELKKIAKDHSNVHVIHLDVSDFKSYAAVVKKVEEKVGAHGLTCLLNNAGIIDSANIKDITPEKMMELYRVNCIAPLMLAKAFVPLIKRASEQVKGNEMSASRAAILNMSTKVASISDNSGGGMYAYRCSKIALNMATKNLSIELKEFHILCVNLHPGWVQTDMGTKAASTSSEESVSGLLKVISTLTASKNAGFFDFKGNSIPW